ncbi:MAG: HEAT repeat domain-containing protein [Candidatus Firestonebacteria bacterium]|nr:HEAT repeat domain-containing protein [Candidatus Firestonebacteria bacterium]
MKKNLLIILFFIISIFIGNTMVFSEDEEEGLEGMRIFTQEELKAEKDTTKIKTMDIDYSMLDETYIVAKQSKDIEEVRGKRVEQWILQLSTESNPLIKKDSILVLGKLREKQAIPRLISIMRDKNETEEIRISSAWALGNMGPAIITELEKLAYDNDPKIRIYAVWALGVTRSRGAIPVLKEINKKTSLEDKVVKKAILQTLKLFDTSLLKPENW